MYYTWTNLETWYLIGNNLAFLMDLVVIHKNKWAVQISTERPGDRCSVQKEPPPLQGPLGALQLQKGWGTALHVQECGKASARGFREGWEGDCTWRLDVLLLALPHLSINRLFWVCTAVAGTRFSPSEFCIRVLPKPSWPSVLTALCCELSETRMGS